MDLLFDMNRAILIDPETEQSYSTGSSTAQPQKLRSLLSIKLFGADAPVPEAFADGRTCYRRAGQAISVTSVTKDTKPSEPCPMWSATNSGAPTIRPSKE